MSTSSRIAAAQGRASVKVANDIATLFGEWQLKQRRCRIGAMSFAQSSVVVMRGCVSTGRVVASHRQAKTPRRAASTGAITSKNGRGSHQGKYSRQAVPEVRTGFQVRTRLGHERICN